MEEARAWAAEAVEKSTTPAEQKAESGAGAHIDPPVPTSSDPLLGSVIDRRYRIDALLGKGGMGAVYRGEQIFIHRPVALKILHPAFAAQEEFIERFRREAEVAVRLHSPNVVEVLDFGQTADGRFYLAMELLRGESLQSLLRREQRLEPARVTALLGELLVGLRAVHAAGIVHRDLKPDNLWLAGDESGRSCLKLLDFGIAKVAEPGSAQTQLGLIMGTPEYLAPEQALGEPVDHRADLYSVGIIAFVLATGRHPFPGRDARALLSAHLTTPVPSLLDVAPELASAPHLVQFVARATVRDRTARAQSVDELLALLPVPAPDSEALTYVPAKPLVPEPVSPELERQQTVVALRQEGQELLSVTKSAVRLGSKEALNLTLKLTLWFTRLLRWLLLFLGHSYRLLKLGVSWAFQVATERGPVLWAQATTTRRGRIVAAVSGIVSLGLLGVLVWSWNSPLHRARRALEAGEPGAALTMLADAPQGDAEVQLLRGHLLHVMKRPGESLAAYEAATAKEPKLWRRPQLLADLIEELAGTRSGEAEDALVEAGPAATKALLTASKDATNARKRWGAIEALRRTGHEDQVDLVLAYIADLASDDCNVVTKACHKLAELGDQRAVAPLEEVAKRKQFVFEACEAPAARAALRKLKPAK